MAGKKGRIGLNLEMLEFKILLPKIMYKLAEEKTDNEFNGNKSAYGRSLIKHDLNCDQYGNKNK